MKLNNIDQMNTQEKLQAMDDLWHSLLEAEAKIESPDWHGDILAERKAKIESGEARFITLKELKNIKF